MLNILLVIIRELSLLGFFLLIPVGIIFIPKVGTLVPIETINDIITNSQLFLILMYPFFRPKLMKLIRREQ